MLLIPCPYCGLRAEIEFRCGGESHIQRPGPHHSVSDAEWADYLFYRRNSKAEHLERWFHTAGCRRWFNVARDTVTHHIRVSYRMGDPCPISGGEGSLSDQSAMSPRANWEGAS